MFSSASICFSFKKILMLIRVVLRVDIGVYNGYIETIIFFEKSDFVNISNEIAGICGLFCGTCQAFPQYCGGCLSNRVAASCVRCSHGFRDCAKEHQVAWCWECAEFPCGRLEQFSKEHIVNGICHHEHVIDDLYFMRVYGVEAWIEKQVKEHTCQQCGNFILWFEQECRHCTNNK